MVLPAKPPKIKITPLEWVQKNLFSTWYNGVLTILSLLFIYFLVSSLGKWAFTIADWNVLQANLRLFFVGTYPVNLLWRIWTTLAIIISMTGLSWGIFSSNTRLFNRQSLIIIALLTILCILISFSATIQATMSLLGLLILVIISAFLGQGIGRKFKLINQWLSLIWLLTFFLVLWLLEGGLFIKSVSVDSFSGLVLTVYVALISIVLSFPFGILLALGRQSKLPVIRWLAIGYIEIIRGLPLIGILFMAQVMLPLVLPPGVRPDRVIRAICGFIIFSAAYLAENIRGGLQSIPRGQFEAAKALGLPTYLILALVILPQAIRAVIPAIVGQFISLFKDTSLLAIVGLVDLLGISQSILANPKFIGRYSEVYLFIAFIYWLFCYSMSWFSRQLEHKH